MLPVSTYVIYIAAVPCKIWHALVSANQTLCYLGKAVDSTWRVGSSVNFRGNGDELCGQVLEYDYPNRIRIALFGISEAGVSPLSQGKFPKAHITYELESLKSAVKLTVSQSMLAPSDEVESMTANVFDLPEWPAVLSSLKTMLETGEAIDITKLSPAFEDGSESKKSSLSRFYEYP